MAGSFKPHTFSRVRRFAIGHSSTRSSRFDLRHGQLGYGAWEVTARYCELNLDQRVFDAGLADPTLWTNNAKLVDVGLNWYMNQFVKIYFNWEHAIFADPVQLNPGQFETSNDLFWIRTQVYF